MEINSSVDIINMSKNSCCLVAKVKVNWNFFLYGMHIGKFNFFSTNNIIGHIRTSCSVLEVYYGENYVFFQ